MARYLIEAPHMPEDCLKALDEVLAQGPAQLAQYDWGCMDNNHTCYTIVEKPSKSAAESIVPTFLRSKARVVELNKFTPEQVKSFHG